MGCKYNILACICFCTNGINSYIVGCKLRNKTSIACSGKRINSYIVGCKCATAAANSAKAAELIVT